MQTVSYLLLSLALSYGEQLHASEVSAATTTTQQTNLQELSKMSLAL